MASIKKKNGYCHLTFSWTDGMYSEEEKILAGHARNKKTTKFIMDLIAGRSAIEKASIERIDALISLYEKPIEEKPNDICND